LGERLNGIQEVSGSIPLGSTNSSKTAAAQAAFLLHEPVREAGSTSKAQDSDQSFILFLMEGVSIFIFSRSALS
jgi:hypothetical protein